MDIPLSPALPHTLKEVQVMQGNEKHFKEPPKTYLVYVVIFVLLSLISVINYFLGTSNLSAKGLLILILASIQAYLLASFYMYLRYEDKLTLGYALMPLFFILLFFAGNAWDINWRTDIPKENVQTLDSNSH